MSTPTRLRLTAWHARTFKTWSLRNAQARQAYDRHPESTHRQAARHPDTPSRRKA